MAKSFWKSKTLWTNVIAMFGLILADRYGVTLSAESVGGILALINIILRIVTKEPIVWNTNKR